MRLAPPVAPSPGPLGIHAAFAVIDSRSRLLHKPGAVCIELDAAAETLNWLTKQRKSAKTFALEVRGFAGTW
ncbi:MAG: hypothetical protein L0Y50_05740 [Beijerinckiaceae bacterium]|nr:hypothetical protein [Beijerinckiaceae bacterium]MCI0735761.1 hypothetical protein [Beijerinckiaceae bacterium]